MSHELRLEIVLDVIYQEVHDRLGHRVLNVLSNDEEIAFDELLDDFAVVLLPRRQFACWCGNWLQWNPLSVFRMNPSVYSG